jgi:hypothetical protein
VEKVAASGAKKKFGSQNTLLFAKITTEGFAEGYAEDFLEN